MDAAQLRRAATLALVAGLCLAAVVAIIGLLTNSMDDIGWQVVGTSLGFSAFIATGSSGLALRLRREPAAKALGGAVAVVSAVGFALLTGAIWVDDAGSDWLWQGFGVAGLLALWGAHASLMTRTRRRVDSPTIRWLTVTAIGSLALNTLIGCVAILDVTDDVDDDVWRLVGILVVITVLSTALVPILRRLAPAVATTDPGASSEVAEIARRLGEMDLPPQAQAEVARLRRLAARAD